MVVLVHMGLLLTLGLVEIFGGTAYGDEIRHCPVSNAEGVFSYQLLHRDGPAHCGGTVLSFEPTAEGCRMAFVTSAHCLVGTRSDALHWKIRRGDRLRTRMGALRVRDIGITPAYLQTLKTEHRAFQPMNDLALVVAEGLQCPAASTPLLSRAVCTEATDEFPFLLACPGDTGGVALEPVYSAAEYSQQFLSRLGLEPGRDTPWMGYSRSRKGCSGGPWLKYSKEGECGYRIRGLCGVHAGHAKSSGEIRETRGTPTSAPGMAPQWVRWCETLNRWGLSCPVSGDLGTVEADRR